MKLFYRKYGEGKPLIILHGLFGASDNWQTLGKQFAEHFEVYLVDQRNHGRSPHNEEWNYEVMSDDLLELLNDNNIEKAIIIGHSMGGKTAMQFAVEHPEKVDHLIVADIAPKAYPVHHQEILDALLSVDLEKISSRKEAEDQLSIYIKEWGVRQFLLKNLYWRDDEAKKLAWRFNLDVINKNIEVVGAATPLPQQSLGDMPVLFIRGEKSGYIKDADMDLIQQIFPTARLVTFPKTGHWLHAEQPQLFYDTVMEFLE